MNIRSHTDSNVRFRRLRTAAALLCALLLLAATAQAQNRAAAHRFRIMSYNVENLFDTRHDAGKNDTEFLPDGDRHWTRSRYDKKLNAIAKVITAVGEGEVPALVGLVEVENDSVLTDLTQHTPLRGAGYRYVMTSSPDRRGIDVALLYQPGRFEPVSRQSIRIPPLSKSRNATRDILHVCGQLQDKSLLDVFVCHLPSRSGGQKETEPYRLLAARTLRHAVDSIMNVRQEAQIVIMGDFNDYPADRALSEVLRAKLSQAGKPQERSLYNLLGIRAKKQKGLGSYRYHGSWGLLDHLIVNGRLLRQGGRACHVKSGSADVFRRDFLLEDDTRYGGKQPFRTFRGTKYNGGYSDHLPVYVDLMVSY